MEMSREKTLLQVERAMRRSVARLHYTVTADPGEAGLPVPRFIFCFKGVKRIRARFDNGELREGLLPAGEAIYAGPPNHVEELWNTAHEMISVVFWPEMVRALYIAHDGVSPPPLPAPRPTLYYHTAHRLDAVGVALLNTLNLAAFAARPEVRPPGGEALLRALMEMVRALMAADASRPQGKHNLLWREIYNYVNENIARDVSRARVAKRFRLHPVYLSRVFRRELGIGFVEYVTAQRLTLAEGLLRRAEMNLGEVARSCGFTRVGYFIRVFRKKHGRTPGQFRQDFA